MTEILRDDFNDWKNSPVTQAVFIIIAERIRETERELGATAGVDAAGDRYRVGTIQAYKNFLDIDYEYLSNE
jgi:hypothetical protein